MAKLRFVAYYGDPGEYLFAERYSDKTFCPSCERELENASHSYAFCPYCGVAVDSKITFKDDYEDLGPKSIHPLVQKEWQRKHDLETQRAMEKIRQPDPNIPGCEHCKDSRVVHSWDDPSVSRDGAIVLFVAAEISCSSCKRLVHNCGQFWEDLEAKLTCSPGVKTGSVPLSASNPSVPYGLHVAGYRGKRRKASPERRNHE